MNPKKKLKTYNITYRPNESNRYQTETITYQADSIKEAEALFHAEHPEHKNSNKQCYLEIHSPLENYAIDAENEKSAESTTTTTTTTEEDIDSTTTSEKIVEKPTDNNTTTTSTTTTMKKFNILNTFKIVNEYVYHITMLIVGIIPLLLLGVVLFGDNFFLGNIVVFNIQNILDSMGGFVGIITLVLIVTVFHNFYKKN